MSFYPQSWASTDLFPGEGKNYKNIFLEKIEFYFGRPQGVSYKGPSCLPPGDAHGHKIALID